MIHTIFGRLTHINRNDFGLNRRGIPWLPRPPFGYGHLPGETTVAAASFASLSGLPLGLCQPLPHREGSYSAATSRDLAMLSLKG